MIFYETCSACGAEYQEHTPHVCQSASRPTEPRAESAEAEGAGRG